MRFMHIVGPLSRLLGSEAPSPPQDSLASPAPAVGNDEHAQAAAAAGKLEDGEILRKLAGLSETGSGVPPAIERAAQERAAQLIDAGTLDFAQLCTPAANISALLSVAALCQDAARLAQAFALIDDPQRLARLVLEGSSTRIRQLAAQKLDAARKSGVGVRESLREFHREKNQLEALRIRIKNRTFSWPDNRQGKARNNR